jgi:hypothetical protein
MNGNQRMERNQKRQQTGIKVRSTKQKSEKVFFCEGCGIHRRLP